MWVLLFLLVGDTTSRSLPVVLEPVESVVNDLLGPVQLVTAPIRPRYDPAIEAHFRTLLDTLVLSANGAPRAVRVEALPLGRRGRTFRDTLGVADPGDEEALVHEFGHYWAARHPDEATAAADSCRFDPTTSQGWERLARGFTDAIRGLRRGRPPNRLAALIGRFLERRLSA